MNYSIIRYILSCVLEFEALFMTLPCIVALIYREKHGFSFAVVVAACLLIGEIGRRIKPKSKVFYAKEGFVTVSLSWILLSLVGAIPFVLNGEIPNYLDAVFEVASGLTTTGASISPDMAVFSKCGMFWRIFTHWIGGMGVLVLILAILPLSGSYNMHIMRAESPGPSVGKLVPKVRSTAAILYEIYLVITCLEVIALLLTGLPFYDSLLLSFSTAGTGGFGLLNDSLASYSYASQTVITIFMILFGVNFSAYFFIIRRNFKDFFKNEEVRWYLIIIAISAILITWNIRGTFGSLGNDFHQAILQVATIITTTGFSSADFNIWPEFSKTILYLLMLIGACAGSTGGGFKVSRVLVMIKSVKNEITTAMHPRSVKKIHMDGKIVPDNVVRSIRIYLIIYVLIYLSSFLIVSLDGYDFTTNFTAVAACLNNIGPGLSLVGPTGNYAFFSGLSKVVLIFNMLAGRLELLPILMLFHVKTWKE